MTFNTTAQLVILDTPDESGESLIHDPDSEIIVYDSKPDMDEVIENHEELQLMPDDALQVALPEEELVIELEGIPGAPPEALDESQLTVEDEEPKEKDEDENDARNKGKKKDPRWDWESALKDNGPNGFLKWVKEKFDGVPTHSGYDTAGLERAVAYLEKLDDEISKAMRMDLDGDLDANKIEEIRSKIDDGVERIHDRLSKIHTKSRKKKKKAELETGLVKEAQKITGVQGVYVVVPLIVSTIARICINGYVSAGHDMEDTFKRVADKYNLTDRDKLEVVQLIQDMGYPIRADRAFMDGEEYDTTSSDNFDFSANYPG